MARRKKIPMGLTEAGKRRGVKRIKRASPRSTPSKPMAAKHMGPRSDALKIPPMSSKPQRRKPPTKPKGVPTPRPKMKAVPKGVSSGGPAGRAGGSKGDRTTKEKYQGGAHAQIGVLRDTNIIRDAYYPRARVSKTINTK